MKLKKPEYLIAKNVFNVTGFYIARKDQFIFYK